MDKFRKFCKDVGGKSIRSIFGTEVCVLNNGEVNINPRNEKMSIFARKGNDWLELKTKNLNIEKYYNTWNFYGDEGRLKVSVGVGGIIEVLSVENDDYTVNGFIL